MFGLTLRVRMACLAFVLILAASTFFAALVGLFNSGMTIHISVMVVVLGVVILAIPAIEK